MSTLSDSILPPEGLGEYWGEMCVFVKYSLTATKKKKKIIYQINYTS